MSKSNERYFNGRGEQRRALRRVLQELHAQRHSDQRIVDLLAGYLSDDLIPHFARATTQAISRPTIQRIRSADDTLLMGIRPNTIGLIYNFLCHCEELPTELYDETTRIQSAHEMAPLLDALHLHVGAKDSFLTQDKLKSLEGTFHLYRRAWTSPNVEAYIQCILRFDWVGDALFYTEEQRFHDPISNLPVDEIDQGVVLPFGLNVVLIGKGTSKDLLKFFSVHDFDVIPDGHLKVHAFAGNFIAVYGKGPHPGFKGFAQRVEPERAKTQFLTAEQVDKVILERLREE